MAITRTYGNITDALGLASQAGAGDAFRWQFGAERQYQGQLDSEQEMRNRQNNAEISQALDQERIGNQNDQFYAGQNMESQRLQQASQYQQGELANQRQQIQQTGAYQQGELQNQAARDQAYQKYVEGSQARNQGMGDYYDAKAMNVGQAPLKAVSPSYGPGNPEYDGTVKTIEMLQQQLKLAQATQHSKEIYGTPTNPNDPTYQQAVKSGQDISGQIQQLMQAHQQRMQQGAAPQQNPSDPLLPGPSGQPAPRPVGGPTPAQFNPAQAASGGMAPQQQGAPGAAAPQGTTVVIGAVPVPLPAAPPALQPPQPGAPLSQYPQVQQQLIKLYMDKVAQNVPPQQRTPQALDQGYMQYIQSLGWRAQ